MEVKHTKLLTESFMPELRVSKPNKISSQRCVLAVTDTRQARLFKQGDVLWAEATPGSPPQGGNTQTLKDNTKPQNQGLDFPELLWPLLLNSGSLEG